MGRTVEEIEADYHKVFNEWVEARRRYMMAEERLEEADKELIKAKKEARDE